MNIFLSHLKINKVPKLDIFKIIMKFHQGTYNLWVNENNVDYVILNLPK